MKDLTPYKCDVCKRPKGEGNGWLLGVVIHVDSCSDKCALTKQAEYLRR